ncbi:SDR family oxidoreductase [Streptomyces thermoviolaceus]|jgi:ketoreductase RED2|uniref:SDR family oxidoreductase n=1 Tax=Streptomyces thermoviolaceus subsp. thermoviolaceus TaxID=66860 RepID=A0ABX0YZ90_STRTL|nr:SDR family oxidoreductase [Streptomyces thermoviolaceus]MCM3264791.1 SDR family oxidoreductase [Streptomyces thermoviolaceus]NJP16373.1 SDR family oxidoreductase [Streptomyces thermoviolaceus subsp. thermoviolaceus]WTD48903.1 SDR family oxidoreductase [Streptomyces thermoviolaceus]GHB08694.1 3-oxoacyl-ACP reductase [Streptomyces thermoviolaceus subsp. thermoviolaceus]
MAADAPVALVTGSSSGIGRALAERLATEGYRVVVNSARSTAAGKETAAALPDGLYVQADVSVPDEAQRLVDTAVGHYGRLDVLVNNAGRTRKIPHADLAAATPQVWREIFDLNVFGTWQTTVAAMPHLSAGGSGVVVNVSSVAGSRPAGSSIPYAVSKAALEHMTRLLAHAVGPAVRVNAVAPGLVETPWTQADEFFAPIAEHVRRSTPLRRTGRPEDVADAVLGLVRSTYTTGQVLLVDGGAHLM